MSDLNRHAIDLLLLCLCVLRCQHSTLSLSRTVVFQGNRDLQQEIERPRLRAQPRSDTARGDLDEYVLGEERVRSGCAPRRHLHDPHGPGEGMGGEEDARA